MKFITSSLLTFILAWFITIPLDIQATTATTANNPDIPVAELDWLLKPMKVDQLEVESNAWLELLKDSATEISKLNIQLLEIQEQEDELTEDEKIKIENEKEKSKELSDKDRLLEQLTELNDERTALIDRAQTTVDAFEKKGGDEEKVISFNKYIEVAGGATVDISDKEAVFIFIKSWLTSKEGGLRWLTNISKFVIIIIAFYFLSCLLSRAARHALDASNTTSMLMRNFLIVTVRRSTIIIGIIIGLSALEVDIGPLLAVIGAASFVIAFALQNSLGNFASGMLIMMFRPFDVGDLVELAGVEGNIKAVNLLSTQMITLDNKAVVIPNNEVWGGVITNYTVTGKRRVDMMFGISYQDDIDKARTILKDIVNQHQLVLKEPKPDVYLHELGDSSVNFIVRPWVKPDDYWTVFWDVTREVKIRLDEEGISIPFPQRDVHVYNSSLDAQSES